jgi:hypothetical protein
MADHGQVEYGTATGNDLAAHEDTYNTFVQLAYIGSCLCTCIVIALAIGGGTHRWGYSIAILLIAPIFAAHGLASGAKGPMGVMVLLALLTMGFVAS